MIWNVFRLQTCNSKNLSHFFVTIQIFEFAENYEIKFGRSFRVHILRLVFLVLVIRNQLSQSVMLKLGYEDNWNSARISDGFEIPDILISGVSGPEMLQY